MKKIYAIFAAMMVALSMSASEQILWAGSCNVNWGDANVVVNAATMASVPAGSTVYVYYNVPEAEYHSLRVVVAPDWSGDVLPQVDGMEAQPSPYSFVYDSTSKALAEAEGKDGIIITGFGLEVTKVSLFVEDENPGEDETPGEGVIWSGSWYVSWELPDGDVHKEWKGIGQEEFAGFTVGDRLYLMFEIVTTDGYHQYKIDDWGWNVLPGQGEAVFNADTEVEIVITQALKDAVAANGFAVHGHGFNVTRARVVSITTAIDNVNLRNNGIRYNLLGQPVDEDYKGIVILNGQKMIVR